MSLLARVETFRKEIMKYLRCPKCKVDEQVYEMNIREESTLAMYNEFNPRVRQSDGLNIYPLYCFICRSVTESLSKLRMLSVWMLAKRSKSVQNQASVLVKHWRPLLISCLHQPEMLTHHLRQCWSIAGTMLTLE